MLDVWPSEYSDICPIIQPFDHVKDKDNLCSTVCTGSTSGALYNKHKQLSAERDPCT